MKNGLGAFCDAVKMQKAAKVKLCDEVDRFVGKVFCTAEPTKSGQL